MSQRGAVMAVVLLLSLQARAAGYSCQDNKVKDDADKAQAGLLVDLAWALKFTHEVAAQLDQALHRDDAIAPLVQRYCPGHPVDHPALSSSADCAGARVIIEPDGSVTWQPIDKDNRATPANTFCLRNTDDKRSWGPLAIVALRRANQSERDSACFAAASGRVYAGPALEPHDDSTTAELKIWAAPSEPALQQPLDQATQDAKKKLGDGLSAWLRHKWAAALQADVEGATTAAELKKRIRFDKLENDVCGGGGELDKPNMSVATGEAMFKPCDEPLFKTQLEQVHADFADLESSVAAVDDKKPFPTALAAKLCQYADKSAQAASLASNKDLLAAERLLILRAQPHDDTRVPSPVFAGEFPVGDARRLIDLTPQVESRRKLKTRFYGGDTIIVFAHEMQRATDKDHPGQIAAIFQGKQLTQEGTEVAEVFLAVFKALASAWGITLPGGTAPESVKKAQTLADCEAIKEDGPKLECLLKNDKNVRDAGALSAALYKYDEPKGVVFLIKALVIIGGDHGKIANETKVQLDRAYVAHLQDPALLGNPIPLVAGDPTAPLYSKVLRSDDVQDGYEYDARICHDVGKCDASVDESSVSADAIAKVPSAHLIVGTATELSWGINTTPSLPLGGYSFDPIGGGGGPQAFYLLRGHNGVQDQFIFSQLVTFYPIALAQKYKQARGAWPGFAIAGGPSLFTASQTAFLKQWNFRLGFEVLPSLLATIGFSARQIDVPVGRFVAGDIVAVGIKDPAPTFAQNHPWAWQISIGIAVDLATAGKLIADSATSSQKSAPDAATAASSKTTGKGGGK